MICTHFGNQQVSAVTVGALVYRIMETYNNIEYFALKNDNTKKGEWEYSNGLAPSVTLELPSTKILTINNDEYTLYQADFNHFEEYVKGRDTSETNQ